MDINNIANQIEQDIKNEKLALEFSHADFSKLNYKLTLSEELLIIGNLSEASSMLGIIAAYHKETTLLISSVLAQYLVDNDMQIWASIDEEWEEIKDDDGNIIDCEINCTCYPYEEGEEVPPLNDKICKYCIDEVYAIEYNGEHFQSVFPCTVSEKSQLHSTMLDAHDYLTKECEVKEKEIKFYLSLYVKQKIDEKMVAQAEKILSDESFSIDNQLYFILIEYGMGRVDGMIDHISGVQPIEQFEHTSTVKGFLEHIGFSQIRALYELPYKYTYKVYDRSDINTFLGVINTSLTTEQFEIAYREIEEKIEDYSLQDIVDGLDECIKISFKGNVTI